MGRSTVSILASGLGCGRLQVSFCITSMSRLIQLTQRTKDVVLSAHTRDCHTQASLSGHPDPGTTGSGLGSLPPPLALNSHSPCHPSPLFKSSENKASLCCKCSQHRDLSKLCSNRREVIFLHCTSQLQEEALPVSRTPASTAPFPPQTAVPNLPAPA